jgi:transposase
MNLKKWMNQLRWQRLPSFEKLAATLLKHVNGILNYCRIKVRFGVVEAINGNIRMSDQPRPRLEEPALPPVESQAHGLHQR